MQADKLAAAVAAAAARTGERPGVDAVIVSADMGAMTGDCVAALAGAPVTQVIVVDNASAAQRDSGAEQARAQLERSARIVAQPQPQGFAAANNRGVAAGSAEYVLLLNSDVCALPGAVELLLDALRADPAAVAAGGRLVDPESLETQSEYRPRPFPTLANFVVILLGIEELWPGNPVTRRYHGVHLADEEHVQAVAQPAAAALMVRRGALEAAGGFDERFWFWFEDSDLLLRLSARGRILYVPRAVFRHLGGGSFRRWSKVEQIRSLHHGVLHYADAHFPRAQRALLGALVLVISLPRVLLFARSRPDEARAWRGVTAGGMALLAGRRVPAIAPAP